MSKRYQSMKVEYAVYRRIRWLGFVREISINEVLDRLTRFGSKAPKRFWRKVQRRHWAKRHGV